MYMYICSVTIYLQISLYKLVFIVQKHTNVILIVTTSLHVCHYIVATYYVVYVLMSSGK